MHGLSHPRADEGEEAGYNGFKKRRQRWDRVCRTTENVRNLLVICTRDLLMVERIYQRAS